MTLDEIKAAVESGHKVHWKHTGYEVIGSGDDMLINCVQNDNCIGLTWTDGVTMNGKAADFFVAGTFKFEVGRQYETQEGQMVEVLDRTGDKGYECLVCSDNAHRYDRSTSRADAGRVTGTPHDYSCPQNFKR